MNSGAGSGEYASTSTGPSRSASDSIARVRASASRMSAVRARGPDPIGLELAGEIVELGLIARDEPDGQTLAAEALGDGKPEVRAGADDDDGHGKGG